MPRLPARTLCAWLAISTFGLPACAMGTPPAPSVPPAGLPAALDCVRERDFAVIEAHRGGAAPGFPENALATLKRARAGGAAILEIDVQQTSDGVLVLVHDPALEGRAITKTSYGELAKLNLRDPQGRPTKDRIATLEEALRWAKGEALLKLDPKPGTDFARLVEAVSAAQAQDRVIVIAYTLAQAVRLKNLAPELVLSVAIRDLADLDEARAAGLDDDRLIAWTGTGSPDPQLNAHLAAAGIEVFFGTFGRENALDRRGRDRAAEDRSYADLLDQGILGIATDRPLDVAAALSADDAAVATCFGGEP